MEKILTVPSPMKDAKKYFVSGNHYISLGSIEADGRIQEISHLLEKTNSLIEYCGENLLSLQIGEVLFKAENAEYVHDFIPKFQGESHGMNISFEIVSPEKIKGFVYRVVINTEKFIQEKIKLVFKPEEHRRTIFHSYPLQGTLMCTYNSWTNCGAAEIVSGSGVSALAFSANGDYEVQVKDSQIIVEKDIQLEPGEQCEVLFYVAAGSEIDGACLNNMDMRRRGRKIYEEQVKVLEKRHIKIEDEKLNYIANLNLNFCYYFSLGYSLDTDKLMLMTSKSSRYYVSAAYWARDCMLWAYPAIVIMDKEMAKKALLEACTTYLKNGPYHACYINGTNLYPGFELDELVAPIIALGHYLDKTGDKEILRSQEIKKAVEFTVDTLKYWYDEEYHLYGTELNPSDDPVQCPFLTYDNYLTLRALIIIKENFPDCQVEIQNLTTALSKHCTVEVNGKLIYAWATDGKDKREIYDNPPGSMLLMPYYKVVSKEEEIYKNTVEYYFSKSNEYFYEEGNIIGQGSEHAAAPWPMSISNLLHAGAKEERLLASLRAMEMDNGIVCETVDQVHGNLHTGAAFATCAGFVAHGIVRAYED